MIEALLGHYRVLVVIHGQPLAVARVLHRLPRCAAPNIQTMGTWAPMHDSKLCREHCTLVGCGASRAAQKEGRSQLSGRKGDRSEVIADCAMAGWACGSLEGYGSRWMATDIIPKERFQYCAITGMSQFVLTFRGSVSPSSRTWRPSWYRSEFVEWPQEVVKLPT